MVPFLWVTTTNWVSWEKSWRYWAKLSMLASSRAASISSRKQKGVGFKMCIRDRPHHPGALGLVGHPQLLQLGADQRLGLFLLDVYKRQR